MPRAQARERKIWEALAKIHLEKLAFAASYIEEGEGSKTIRKIVATDWLQDNNILFDTGKRLQGWLKERAATLGGSLKRDEQSGSNARAM